MKNIGFFTVVAFVVYCVLSAPPVPVRAATAGTDVVQRLAFAGGLDKYPRANIIFVEKRREIRYEEDGTYVDRTYLLIKCLTEPAVSFLATMPILEYYSYRSEGKVLSARVIKPDGRIVDVPAESIVDTVNPMYADMNVKDENMRLKQITFKNLQVGDAIECAVEERCIRPVTNDFELKEGKYLQEDEPVIHTRIEINGPSRKPLRHVLKYADNLPVRFSSETKGERTIYVWEASDIPAFVSESGWNTRQHFAARLLASTITSWQEMSRATYRINEPAIDENDAIRAVVAELTRGLTHDDEKIAAIQLFLRTNIGYKGLTSISAYRSKAATQTLADRFGVCRDVAVLMCSMLKVAGISSFPAATGYNRVFDYEIPHDIFQHMIVAVPNRAGGGYRLFDPTSLLYTGDPLPGYAGGAPLLVCTPEGENLARIPHIPASENMGNIQAKSRIETNGDLRSTVTITGKGFYDEDLRNWRRRTKPEDYTKRWEGIVAQLHPAAKVVDLSTTNPDDLATRFKVIISFEVPGYAPLAQNSIAMTIPLATDLFERVLTDVVARATRPERRYPLIVTTAVGVQAQETLALPRRVTVDSVPEAVSVKARDLTLAIRYSTAGSEGDAGRPVLEFNKMFLVDSRQFDPDSYMELRKVLERNAGSKRDQVTLGLHRLQ